MVTLGGANAYTGGTTVLAGTLQAGIPGAFVNNTAYTVNGGTLDLNNFVLTMSALNGTGGVVNLGSAALTVDNAGANAYSGIIQGTGSLTKIGAGVLSLSGNSTYGGGTNILGGVLAIGADINLGAASGTLTFDGGTLETLASFTSARATTLNAAGGTFDSDAGTNFLENGIIVGVGGLTKIGAGMVTLGGANAYTGGTTVLAGTLQAGAPGAFVNDTAYTVNGGTLDLNNFILTMSSLNGAGGVVNLGSAALTVDNTGANAYSGILQGTGSLTKIGAGVLSLSGNNTYGGGTNILGGVLSVTSDLNLGTGNIEIGNNAELLTTGTSFSSGKGITLSVGGGTLANASNTTAVYGGVIGGTGGLVIGDGINQGTIALNGANIYSGGTTINGVVLEIGADANLGAPSGGLIFNGGTLQTLASFSTARATVLNAAGGTFETASGTTFTETGSITGTGGLTKIGAGIATLGGDNTYTGGTTINAGMLIVNSAQALGLGDVVVNKQF